MMNDVPLILVAEDEPDDVFFLRHALRRARIFNRLVVTTNGQEAIQYLKGEGQFVDRDKYPLPDLFLLDLKMPMLSGFDVLTWLQSRPDISQLAVVVLSSSAHEADRQKALALGASDYRVKPTQLEQLVQILRDLQARWLK